MSRAVLPAGALAMLVVGVPLAGCATAQPMAARGARSSEREPALAEFEDTLAANASATAALEQWCARRGIAREAQVRATVLEEAEGGIAGNEAAVLAAEARRALGVGLGEPLGFRHVRLDCGGVVLSEAFNWYVPGRLAPAMNRQLETTRTPFGKVAAPLGYRRELIESRRGAGGGCPPGVILSHRAMLRLPDGHPLALLVECYTEANLGG